MQQLYDKHEKAAWPSQTTAWARGLGRSDGCRSQCAAAAAYGAACRLRSPGRGCSDTRYGAPVSGNRLRLMRRRSAVDPLDDDGGRHAACGAHGNQAVAAAGALELIEYRADQDRACCTDRVAQRYGAAIHIDLGAVDA